MYKGGPRQRGGGASGPFWPVFWPVLRKENGPFRPVSLRKQRGTSNKKSPV